MPGQWIHEVVHEVFDSASAAAQMPLQALTHHAPAKPRSIADGRISVLDAQHALLDEVEHLAIERRLQAVRDMAGKLLLQVNRLLADRRVERHRRLDRFGRGLRSADHLHERNDVRRVERMPDEDALGVLALRLHHARRDSRRARGDDRVRRRGGVHVGEELHLEIGPLGAVFLDEVGLRKRLLHVRREGQAVARCAGRKANGVERRPGRRPRTCAGWLPRSARGRLRPRRSRCARYWAAQLAPMTPVPTMAIR